MTLGLNPDCHMMNDHNWRGSSICADCGARLRCDCGAYVREDNLDAHLTPERCRFIASLPEGEGGTP